MADENNKPQEAENPFQIHKIYVKEMTFEMPNGAETFATAWQPELDVEVHSESKALAEKDTHDVTLRVKAVVKSNDKVAFEAEVKQAGIFTITGLEKDQLHHTLGAFCPNVLYPYLREALADMVLKSGFPQLNLAPINFEALYQQQLEAAKK